MPQYVDVIIPRGGKGLIERISRDAKDAIKHLDGNCHVYVDDPCDIDMAVKVADDAKTNENTALAMRVKDCWWPARWRPISCPKSRQFMRLKALR